MFKKVDFFSWIENNDGLRNDTKRRKTRKLENKFNTALFVF